ncbi:hypothetical protein WICPIJ_006855, partial [Wickerhamomyces pijperi]
WENVYGFDYSQFIPLVMSQPLIETVENKAVVTNHYKLIEFDLNTVTIEDLAFHEQFRLKATRDDSAHALVAWFDIEFPSDEPQNKVCFSTGPHVNYTHWQQTIFYLDQVLDLKKGETVEGSLASRPNETNNRELDIELT